MPSKNTTTVVLTDSAQEIKEDLAPIYGLKNILSAGIVLFGQLDSDQQKQIIRIANGEAAGLNAALKLLNKPRSQGRPPKGPKAG